MQLVRVATPNTEAAWVARASQRTIKHLREEVAAALVAVRWSGEGGCPPPTDGEVAAFQVLEQAVVGGGIARGRAAGACAESVRRLVEPVSGERRRSENSIWFDARRRPRERSAASNFRVSDTE